MPTRLLREGILTSDRVNQLSADGEVFYRRLMSKVDDHGLFDARLSILRASLYPLRTEAVTDDNCLQWLTDCINARLIIVYQIDGKPFLKMLDTKWQVRSDPKYPKPNNTCKQLKAPVHLDVVRSRCTKSLYEDEVVVVDVVVETPVDKVQNGNGKDLEARAEAVGIKRHAGEKHSMFMLRVASEESKRRPV